MKVFALILLPVALTGCAVLQAINHSVDTTPPPAVRLAYAQQHYGYDPAVWSGICKSGAIGTPQLNALFVSDQCTRQRIGHDIATARVTRGMTKDDLRTSWGSPCSSCAGTITGSYGSVWQYGHGDFAQFVYFDASGHVINFDKDGA